MNAVRVGGYLRYLYEYQLRSCDIVVVGCNIPCIQDYTEHAHNAEEDSFVVSRPSAVRGHQPRAFEHVPV